MMRPEWLQSERYRQTLENARQRIAGPGGQCILDRTLDMLIELGSVTGESRPTPKRPGAWVTALHVLTEQIVGRTIESPQHPVVGGDSSEVHSVYNLVTASILLLEAEGLVVCYREQDEVPWKHNAVYRIDVVLT